MRKIVMLALIAFLFTSCYNTRILVGDVKPTEPVTEVNKEWTHHFLFGLVPGGNAKVNPIDYLPAGQENYIVKTNTSFLNGFVAGLTFGIYTPTQVKYYVPMGGE